MITIASEVFDLMLSEADAAYPRECCGILTGMGTYITAGIPAANVHPTPETQFEIDPHALVNAHRKARKGGPQVIGYYHSHPSGPAEPSETDRAHAAGDGMIWAIIAGEEVTFWSDLCKGFEPLSYTLAYR